MTYYKLTRFSGIAPAVSSRLLGEQFAQTSQNIDFEAGRITPITEETTTATLTAGTRNSIYYYENSGTNQWLQWDNDYIKAVENVIGVKISSISTSPERQDTILIQNPFEN